MHPWKSTMLSMILILGTIHENGEAFEFKLLRRPYEMKVDLLTEVMRQDEEWKFVFDQGVFYELDRTDYKDIIDGALLSGATYDLPTSDDPKPAADGTAVPTGDAIRPYPFLKNIFATNSHRIGTVVTMAVEILRKSYRCLAYKNLTHLLTLIRVEIGRNKKQRKAVSWSEKTKPVVADILMKMTALLGYSDSTILKASRFLDSYDRNNTEATSNKYNYTPRLDEMTKDMRMYVAEHCVRAPKTDREIAIELKVLRTDDLYESSTSLNIPNEQFKEMFQSSLAKIDEHFGNIPLPAVGMSPDRWDDIVHFRRFHDDNDEKDDKDDNFEFVRIAN